MWDCAIRCLCITVLVLSSATAAPAQDKKDPEPILSDLDMAIGASVRIAGQGAHGNVLGVLSARMMASEDNLLTNRWPEWKFFFSEPLPISFRYLDGIVDGRAIVDTRYDKSKPSEFWTKPGSPDRAWHMAFTEALRRSDESTPDMFDRAAERTKGVDFAKLKKTPAEHRGKIVTVSGKLTRIQKRAVGAFAPESVAEVYVGYVAGSSLGAPPYVIAFTELPEKAEPNRELNIYVTFQGYFLSLVQFPPEAKDEKGQGDLFGPFLVGRAPVVTEPDEPMAIHPSYLKPIVDNRPMVRVGIEKSKPIPEFWTKPGGPDWGWYMAYNDGLNRANDATLEMFKKAAAEHKHLGYPALKATPEAHRGKIITVTGRMKVLRAVESPRYVRWPSEKLIYTAYIIGPTPQAPPFVVAFVDLPDGLKPSETMDVPVTFHGYFLSLVRFPAEKGSPKGEDIIAPYLVGKTVIAQPKRGPDEPISYAYITAIVGGLVAVAFIAAAIMVWFQRGDRQTQAEIAAVREKANPFSLEPEAESAPAPAEPPAATPIDTGIKPESPPKPDA